MSHIVPDIFKDPKLQKQFDKDGFVKIELLSDKDVENLKELFNQYYPDPSADFYSSSYENNFSEKKKMSDEIGKIIVPCLENVFMNYAWFGSAFLSKGNGPRSEMPMHQDWTIVDEKKYVAMNIWTPLQDTTEENGTIEVIPGSHRWHESVRAPTLPFYYDGFQQKLKPTLFPVPAKANEAVVLNQSIIHYSKANTSSHTRIAITTGIKTKNAPMIFHYWNKDKPDEIQVFEQEDDFLIRFENFHQSIFKRPVMGKSIGTIPFKLPKITEKEVSAKTEGSSSGKLKKGFKEKLFEWMKG